MNNNIINGFGQVGQPGSRQESFSFPESILTRNDAVIVKDDVMEASTETVVALTVMGRRTSDKALVPWSASANDGSENPVGVLIADYPAGTTDVQLFTTGCFNPDLLVHGETNIPLRDLQLAFEVKAPLFVVKRIVAGAVV